MPDTPFDLSLERIALIRRMVIAWNAAGVGAPMIHPLAPYGSTDRDEDISNVTGDDEGAAEEHRALGHALAVFLRHAVLKPGRYQYHNPLAKLDPAGAGDVYRDAATGETPVHITFELTDEHLTLMPALAVMWSDDLDVPIVDPDRPYGNDDGLAAGIARPLGLSGAEERLIGLHHEMQPALQVFTRYGDIAPGDF